MDKIKRYLNLIWELSWVDFKLKYYSSALGLLWSFLRPFMMLLVLYVVFFYFLKVSIENYQIYLLLGIIIWNFFADATNDSMHSVIAKAHILQKINLPPAAVVMSTVIHSFWTFIITLGIFFILFFALGSQLSISAAILFYLVVLLVFLVIGVSFLVVPLYMRFRDFGHIWDIFLQMLFWATPIVYQYTLVPDKYVRWYLLNPMARIIVDARNAVLYNFTPEIKQLLITTIIVAVIFVLGLTIFKKYSRQLVEQL